ASAARRDSRHPRKRSGPFARQVPRCRPSPAPIARQSAGPGLPDRSRFRERTCLNHPRCARCYFGITPDMKLQGIFPPITTPFDYNGDIYISKIQHNVEQWNLTTLSGYVVMGSTGESVMLMPDEKFTVWEQVAKYAAPEKLLIAGTGVESVRETVLLTNRAAEMGYKAAMVRTPHYYKNLINRTDAQMLYFRAVADQSKIPLIIYN